MTMFGVMLYWQLRYPGLKEEWKQEPLRSSLTLGLWLTSMQVYLRCQR
jgi:hypothetical protein